MREKADKDKVVDMLKPNVPTMPYIPWGIDPDIYRIIYESHFPKSSCEDDVRHWKITKED